jgi:hypothetical protein
MSVRDKVRDLLKDSELARNEDTYLILKYWQKFDNAQIDPDTLLKNCTNAETIRRNRQKIQNEEGLYPSTDPEAQKRREKGK